MGFFKNLFGPSKDEIWPLVATEIGGHYIKGGFWKKDVLVNNYKEWRLLLDTYTDNNGENSTYYTRLRVPFICRNSLDLSLYREGFFSGIGKFFGMQDIQVGDRSFDASFIIKGNDESVIRRLLNDPELKRLINRQPNIQLKIDNKRGLFGNRMPKNVAVLYFESTPRIKDKILFVKLFELFEVLLDRMVEMDIAYEKAPEYEIS